jgi:hypothetical protein
MDATDCVADSVSGRIVVRADSISFVAESGDAAAAWSVAAEAVQQLLLSKKPPCTAAKLVASASDGAAVSRVLQFTTTDARSRFAAVVEAQTTKLRADAAVAAARVPRGAAAPVGDAATRTWLQRDSAAHELFELLSAVSAFGGVGAASSSGEEAKATTATARSTAIIDVDASADEVGDDDDAFLTVLRDETRRYLAHPSRQELSVVPVHDALNALVDPTTRALRPLTEAAAASIFRQLPPLAAAYRRLVHSAEDEMTFWVAVARRRFFFSRTQHDAALAECGPALCPVGIAPAGVKPELARSPSAAPSAAAALSEAAAASEMDVHRQRAPAAAPTAAAAGAAAGGGAKVVPDLASAINGASARTVDAAEAAVFEASAKDAAARKSRGADRGPALDDVPLAEAFGIVGPLAAAAAAAEAAVTTGVASDADAETALLSGKRRRQRDSDQADGAAWTELSLTVATMPSRTAGTSRRAPVSMQWLRAGGESSRSLAAPASLPSSGAGDDEARDVKGIVRESVHARAAAFLARVFWRRMRDAATLMRSAGITAAAAAAPRKLTALLKRLRDIHRSLGNVLALWGAAQAGDAAQRGQWRDALDSMDAAISLVASA